MNKEEAMKEVRADIQEAMQYARRPYATGLVANYLLLQMCDKLDKLITKIDIVNANLADIERELHDINPVQ